ncbi:MAG TPA: carboxypeptidase regulatory-like domain-containing protein [Vicinamibacterales bacterium]
MGRIAKGFVVAAFLLVPATAFAQASLSGIVRDASGAVLPGVTVEAASPVLIEKVRTTATDGTGRYQILDLRPGTYTVTFTLPGFATVVREGIELIGTSVVTIGVEMRVGGVQETITVTGESPIVDVQSTTRQVSMTQEVVTAIPSSRTPFTVGVLIPGVRKGAFTGQDVGGSVVQEVASLEANGGRTSDQRMMVNGVALSSMIAGGWGGGAVPNATGTAEFAIDVSGVDAQAATGGVRINFIPRDGGNRFSGTIFGSIATENFAADNYAGSDVQARGLSAPGTIKGNGDFNPGFGGPIKRDRMWFFLSGRYLFADNYVPGMFFNANANNLNRFDYVPTTQQAIQHQDQQIFQARFTWQATTKNKFGVTFDQENFCACPTTLSATTAPEAGVDRRFPVQRFVTVDWNNPLSSRVLLEASGIHRVERWGGMHLQTGKGDNISSLTPGMTGVVDNPSKFNGASLSYRANTGGGYNNSWNWNIHYRAALSYITGSHVFKFGFNNAYGHHENTTYADPSTPYTFQFANGIPTQITYRIVPRTVQVNVDRDLGFFAQDKWTTGRWTLAGGIRYDHFKNSFPAQSIAPTTLAPFLNVSFPEINNLSWHDITPKLGATYDLFGTGKTALKVTLNKYLEGLGTTGFGPAQVTDAPNPILRLNTTTTRTWGDADSDFAPDCDLLNYLPNGECGVLLNAAIFGTVQPGTSYDPDLMTGWGKRAFNWEFTTGVNHEIMPRVSLDVQYARRWYGNIRVTDDRAVGPADYQQFTFVTPSDPRLPDGGGKTLTAFDMTPAAALRAVNYFVTRSNTYGKQTEHFDGINVSVNARLQNGLIVQGGLGPGRVVTNDCEVVDDLPEMLHTFFGNPTRTFVFAARTQERCEQNNGWRTSIQGLAAYTIPKIDVQVSGTFQNLPGVVVDANSLTLAGSTTLGRGFALAPFRFFNITQPGDLYVERLNQIDFRVSKIFRIGTTRTNINFDLYNLLNANSVLTENFTYGAAWRTPQSILLPRLFKIGAQFDF